MEERGGGGEWGSDGPLISLWSVYSIIEGSSI